MKWKKYNGKLDFAKFGFITYEKVLTNVRAAMRGDDFDDQIFISEMKVLDKEIIEIVPKSDKNEEKYAKNIVTRILILH